MQPEQTHTQTQENPYPWQGYGFSMGWVQVDPRIPKGYPGQSLAILHPTEASYQQAAQYHYQMLLNLILQSGGISKKGRELDLHLISRMN